MSISVVTYNNLGLAPYELNELNDLRIERGINVHSKLYFTGIVPENKKDSYVQKTKSETQVEVNLIEEDKTTPIFKGIVLNIEVSSVKGVYYIKAEAISNSYTLDVKLKSRSFQNKGMSYSDLVKQVISDYGADFMYKAKEDTIEKFTMQYQETDWEFIKRMASRFNTGLVPDHISDKPKFFFGIPEGGSKVTIEGCNYSVRKGISDFRSSSENYIEDISENDFIFYEVETRQCLDIGCEVDFMEKSLFVAESVLKMENGIVMYEYILTNKKGLSQNKFYNDKIIGLSIEGTVLKVEKDNIKVHLEIDEKQSEADAWWFAYSSSYTAEGNSGWYCMPEIGDHVLVYFPSDKEEDGISTGSVRKDSDKGESNKVDNPDIKYFRTKSGKELMFSPEEILISAKDGEIFIKLNDKDGIQIISSKPVQITTQEDLIMSADKSITIKAEDSISMTCQGSSINMDGKSDVVSMKGSEVKTN